MCRTVTDVAIMLGVMQSPFGPVSGHNVPSDYMQFLQLGSLKGARIGVDSRYFSHAFGGENDLVKVAKQGLDAMQSLGATLVPTDTGNPREQNFKFYNDEFTVLLYEFKVQIAQYLAGLSNTAMHTLADLIAFDIAHCEEEMKYFGQEVFDLEQAIKPRTQPGLLGSVPPEPPDAGICTTLTTAVAPTLIDGKAQISRHLGTGKPFSP